MVLGKAIGLATVVFAASFLLSTPADDGADASVASARLFGHALIQSRPNDLRAILPKQGKVRVALTRMGPDEGFFGASQVEALFQNFLAVGSVKSFEIVNVDSDGRSASLVHARASLSDREGRPALVGLRLSLQPEGGRWVLREIKESPE